MADEGGTVDEATDSQAYQRNVVVLGWVAFFGGLAQDMIQPVLPVFYTRVLGLSTEFIGLIEGMLTTIVSIMKIGAGWLADALGVRKPIVFAGYALSAVARFSLGWAGSGAAALGLRATDGLGKGLKDAPRDALVAASAGTRKLGFAFGIQRTLDTLGSVAGPLITYGLLRWWTGGGSGASVAPPDVEAMALRKVFWIAGVGMMALPASVIAGALWQHVSPAAPFLFGAAVSAVAFIGLWFVPQHKPAAAA